MIFLDCLWNEISQLFRDHLLLVTNVYVKKKLREEHLAIYSRNKFKRLLKKYMNVLNVKINAP